MNITDFKTTLRIKAKYAEAMQDLIGHPGFTLAMLWEAMPEVRTKLNAYAILMELVDEMWREGVLEKNGDTYRIAAN